MKQSDIIWGIIGGIGIGIVAKVLSSRKAIAAQEPINPNRVPPLMFNLPTYIPHSMEAIELFTEAARRAKLPPDWGSNNGLHEILKKESGGEVGRPNYMFGIYSTDRSFWPKVWDSLRNNTWRSLQDPEKVKMHGLSSATGLGQLIVSNVDLYHLNGRADIGDALGEAIGMLNYIKARYTTPDNAWAKYGKGQEGY